MDYDQDARSGFGSSSVWTWHPVDLRSPITTMAGDGVPNQPGPERQTEVYIEGMADVMPDLPVAYEDLEAALESMDEKAYGYVATVPSGRRGFHRRGWH